MASPKQALSPLLTYKTAEDSLVIDAFFEIFHLGLCLATTGTYFTSCVSQLTPLLRGQSSLRSPCYLHNDTLSFALTTIGFPVFRFPDALPGGEVTIRYRSILRGLACPLWQSCLTIIFAIGFLVRRNRITRLSDYKTMLLSRRWFA